MMNSKMKCWVLSGENSQEPQHLSLKFKAIPDILPHQVLIENSYIGLNPVDWKLIERGNEAWADEHVLGVDGVGTILATGSEMSHLRLGQRVCYHTDLRYDGSFSTHTLVNGNMIMHIPDKLSDSNAASFPCPGLTAYQACHKLPGDLSGRAVLVSGAGGSVGYFLTQLLLQRGARVYITANPMHHASYLAMGVVKAYNYTDPQWQAKLTEDLAGTNLYAALDTVSAESASSLVPLLGYYSHLVPIQGVVELDSSSPDAQKCISVHRIALGAIHRFGTKNQLKELALVGESMLADLASGRLAVRESLIESFENLPYHLAKMKKQVGPIKYLIRI